MALPSFHHPTFLLGNFEHFGQDLVLSPSIGISCNAGVTSDPQGHSAVSFPFRIYNGKIINNITRGGAWDVNFTGYVTNYFEFMFTPSANYVLPQDFIRVEVKTEKKFVGPIGPGNPVYVYITVQTGQLGQVYTYPVYTVDNLTVPEAAVIIETKTVEAGGAADIIVEWNDVVNMEWFQHIINNYPFNPIQAESWRYHTRLNIEAVTFLTAREHFQLLTVQEGLLIPFGIPSEEAFGVPTVHTTVAQVVEPSGIPSEEGFGDFRISGNLTYILPVGIPSEEFFGFPRVLRTTTIESELPPSDPITEGDMRLFADAYIGHYEIQIDDRDVARDDGLETAVLVILGSDREAKPDDILPDKSGYRGGWCLDGLGDNSSARIGTRLWLLRRGKTIQETINKTKEYLKEGFQTLINDSVCKEIKISVWKPDVRNTIAFQLGFVRPGLETIFYQYYYNWENQMKRRININAIS